MILRRRGSALQASEMKGLPGEARELCRCLGTCPRCHPRCWRSSSSVRLGAQILLGKAPSFSPHVPCQAELAAEEPSLEMFLRISLSKLGPTCCVAVFPFLVTKCFFLAALSTSPPLCLFCCSVLPESSSSACGEPDFCQRCHRKLHLPHARVALSAFQSSVLIFAILQAPFSLTLSWVVAQRGREERVGWKERRCAQPLPNHPTGSGVGQPQSYCWAG